MSRPRSLDEEVQLFLRSFVDHAALSACEAKLESASIAEREVQLESFAGRILQQQGIRHRAELLKTLDDVSALPSDRLDIHRLGQLLLSPGGSHKRAPLAARTAWELHTRRLLSFKTYLTSAVLKHVAAGLASVAKHDSTVFSDMIVFLLDLADGAEAANERAREVLDTLSAIEKSDADACERLALMLRAARSVGPAGEAFTWRVVTALMNEAAGSGASLDVVVAQTAAPRVPVGPIVRALDEVLESASPDALVDFVTGLLGRARVAWDLALPFLAALVTRHPNTAGAVGAFCAALVSEAVEETDDVRLAVAVVVARHFSDARVSRFPFYEEWFLTTFLGPKSVLSSKKAWLFFFGALSSWVPAEPAQILRCHLNALARSTKLPPGGKDYVSLTKTRLADLGESTQDAAIADHRAREVISAFARTGVLPADVLNDFVWKKQWVVSSFIPAVLRPDKEDASAESAASRRAFIEALIRAKKLGVADLHRYEAACQQAAVHVMAPPGASPLEHLQLFADRLPRLAAAPNADASVVLWCDRVAPLAARIQDTSACVDVVLSACTAAVAAALDAEQTSFAWAGPVVGALMGTAEIRRALSHRVAALVAVAEAPLSSAQLAALAVVLLALSRQPCSQVIAVGSETVCPAAFVARLFAVAPVWSASAQDRFARLSDVFLRSAAAWAVTPGGNLWHVAAADPVPSVGAKRTRDDGAKTSGAGACATCTRSAPLTGTTLLAPALLHRLWWLHSRLRFGCTSCPASDGCVELLRRLDSLLSGEPLLAALKLCGRPALREWMLLEARVHPSDDVLPTRLRLSWLRHCLYSEYLPRAFAGDVLALTDAGFDILVELDLPPAARDRLARAEADASAPAPSETRPDDNAPPAKRMRTATGARAAAAGGASDGGNDRNVRRHDGANDGGGAWDLPGRTELLLLLQELLMHRAPAGAAVAVPVAAQRARGTTVRADDEEYIEETDEENEDPPSRRASVRADASTDNGAARQPRVLSRVLGRLRTLCGNMGRSGAQRAAVAGRGGPDQAREEGELAAEAYLRSALGVMCTIAPEAICVPAPLDATLGAVEELLGKWVVRLGPLPAELSLYIVSLALSNRASVSAASGALRTALPLRVSVAQHWALVEQTARWLLRDVVPATVFSEAAAAHRVAHAISSGEGFGRATDMPSDAESIAVVAFCTLHECVASVNALADPAALARERVLTVALRESKRSDEVPCAVIFADIVWSMLELEHAAISGPTSADHVESAASAWLSALLLEMLAAAPSLVLAAVSRTSGYGRVLAGLRTALFPRRSLRPYPHALLLHVAPVALPSLLASLRRDAAVAALWHEALLLAYASLRDTWPDDTANGRIREFVVAQCRHSEFVRRLDAPLEEQLRRHDVRLLVELNQ